MTWRKDGHRIEGARVGSFELICHGNEAALPGGFVVSLVLICSRGSSKNKDFFLEALKNRPFIGLWRN